jgi:hypothetical protein
MGSQFVGLPILAAWRLCVNVLSGAATLRKRKENRKVECRLSAKKALLDNSANRVFDR